MTISLLLIFTPNHPKTQAPHTKLCFGTIGITALPQLDPFAGLAGQNFWLWRFFCCKLTRNFIFPQKIVFNEFQGNIFGAHKFFFIEHGLGFEGRYWEPEIRVLVLGENVFCDQTRGHLFEGSPFEFIAQNMRVLHLDLALASALALALC